MIKIKFGAGGEAVPINGGCDDNVGRGERGVEIHLLGIIRYSVSPSLVMADVFEKRERIVQQAEPDLL